MNPPNSSDSEGRGESQPTRLQTAQRAWRQIRTCWAPLVVTDIAYKTLAFVVLAPIVAILFRLFVEISGRRILADQDILFFFISPIGWLCFTIVGGFWLAIMGLEQTALLRILRRKRTDSRVGVIDALRYSLTNGRAVLLLTGRVAGFTLMTVLPFLAVAGAVYLSLLREFDINYYLAEKPPVFWLAIACGVVLLTILSAVLLRLFSGWFLALPLLLFEPLGVRESLASSQSLAKGQRVRLIAWIAGWFLVTTVISVGGAAISGKLGELALSRGEWAIPMLLLVVGALVIVSTGLSLVVNLASTISFAALLLTLYDGIHGKGSSTSPSSAAASHKTQLALAIAATVSWKRLFLVGAVGAVIALAVGVFMFNTIDMQDNTKVTAHRGASTLAPENTMAAVRAALEQKADWIEIDVQETADGHVVVFHDSDFKRVSGSDLKIWDATLDDLKDLDIGSWFAEEFKDERTPTLQEVLEACKGKAGVNIELKYYGHEQQLEERVIEIVESQQMSSEIVIMSLKLAGVEKVKKLRPKWQVGLLAATAIGSLQQADVDFLAVSAGIASRSFIQASHRNGKQVHVWTINDALTMSTMIGRGADNLITDEPSLAREVLEQRSTLSFSERVLLGIAEVVGVSPKFSTQ